MFNISNTFTITGEPDEDYRRYLARKVREQIADFTYEEHSPDAVPLDISLDDSEGDVIAGIAAMMVRNTLYIDMLWVHPTIRRQGIGRRLIYMAEEIAAQRGCTRVRVSLLHQIDYYLRAGYHISGKLQQFPDGQTIYWLCKDLVALPLAGEKDPA